MNWYKISKQSIVSFDFDSTLTIPHPDCGSESEGTEPNYQNIEKLKQHYDQGDQIVITTSRSRDFDKEAPERNSICIKDFLQQHSIPASYVLFTNRNPKGPILKQIGAYRHYDDSDEEIQSVIENGLEAISVK